MRDKFLTIALSQVGYKEKKSNKDLDSKTANAGSGNYTKYGKWYGLNPAPWCCMFVSWCANEAGILGTLIPKYKGAGTGYNWFKNRNQLTMKPKAGDIGFLKPTKKSATSSHTFIVYKVDGNIIATIEGNENNGVVQIHRKLTDKNILGFGSVKYPKEKDIRYVDNVDYEGLNVRYISNNKATGKTLYVGTKVEVLEETKDKAYISKTTYVYKQYLSKTCPKYKTVKGADREGLAVRKLNILGIPSKTYIDVIKNGTKVKVYKTKGKWSKISPDANAWCYSAYLK